MIEDIKIRFDFYKCKDCGYTFKDRKLAEECEKYCNENKKCKESIIRHGIPVGGKMKNKGCC